MAVVVMYSVSLAENTYLKLTSAPADWSGTYLIVCESQHVVFNGAVDEANMDGKGGSAILSNILIAEGAIVGNETLDAATFTIETTNDTDWPWAIKSHSGLYIGHKDTLDNGLSLETSVKKKCCHKLTIGEEGTFIATPRWQDGAAYHLQYNKKSDQMRFRYFAPEDKEPVQIYRLKDETASWRDLRTSSRVTKICENGQIYILRDGVKLNVLGTRL